MQVTLDIFDKVEPNAEFQTAIDVRIDRGSKYCYAYARVSGKADIQTFLKRVHKTKPFDSADHNSYAFRLRSPE